MVFLSPSIKLLFAGASVLLSGCTNLLFQPVKQQLFDPATFNIQVEEHYITSDTDIKLHGWRLPSKTDTRGTLVFLHGNAENISSHVGSVYWLPEHGYEVFLFDYRGFGKSTGATEISGMVRDTENMIVYASRHARSADHKVTVLGHSMGGSLAIAAVANIEDKSSINALITISAFSDYRLITREVLSQHWFTNVFSWPMSFTISNQYRPVSIVSEISPVPLYIMHSRDDEIIPVHHADKLFAAAKFPKNRIQLEGSHNMALVVKKNRQQLLNILQNINAIKD